MEEVLLSFVDRYLDLGELQADDAFSITNISASSTSVHTHAVTLNQSGFQYVESGTQGERMRDHGEENQHLIRKDKRSGMPHVFCSQL